MLLILTSHHDYQEAAYEQCHTLDFFPEQNCNRYADDPRARTPVPGIPSCIFSPYPKQKPFPLIEPKPFTDMLDASPNALALALYQGKKILIIDTIHQPGREFVHFQIHF